MRVVFNKNRFYIIDSIEDFKEILEEDAYNLLEELITQKIENLIENQECEQCCELEEDIEELEDEIETLKNRVECLKEHVNSFINTLEYDKMNVEQQWCYDRLKAQI